MPEPTSPVTLEITTNGGWHRYTAHFTSGDQAIEYVNRKSAEDMERTGQPYGDHSVHELEDAPIYPHCGPVTPDILRLGEYLYPQCDHGMSLDLCMGPDHFMTRDQERMMFGY